MLLAFTFVICTLCAYSLSKMSNGMTSPRAACDLFMGPFSGLAGALIGLMAGLFQGEIISSVEWGFLVGLLAGLLGLGAARMQRTR